MEYIDGLEIFISSTLFGPHEARKKAVLLYSLSVLLTKGKERDIRKRNVVKACWLTYGSCCWKGLEAVLRVEV